MRSAVRTILWYLLLLFAATNSILAMRYLVPHVPFPAHLPNLKLHRYALAVHASFSGIALLVGPFQIGNRFRIRWRKLHRNLGWVYVVTVGFGAVAAIVLTPHTNFGPIAGSGFFTQAVVWLIATGNALWMAIKHRFEEHRHWMLRSYALTTAAITFRILLPASKALALPIAPSYRVIAWMCWLVNLGIVEIYLCFQSASASQVSKDMFSKSLNQAIDG